MLNTWGICEFAEISHDPLRRWDFTCTFFAPGNVRRVEDMEACCGNCMWWLAADEHPGGDKR
jgi:hypothetical protein